MSCFKRWLLGFWTRLSLVVFFALNVGCKKQNETPVFLAIGTEKEAKELVELFLTHVQAGDVAVALQSLCEKNPDLLYKANAFLRRASQKGHELSEDFKVRSALAHWVGREPYYWVDVSFGQLAEKSVLKAYRVRVRDGCIDHLFKEQRAELKEVLAADVEPDLLDAGR